MAESTSPAPRVSPPRVLRDGHRLQVGRIAARSPATEVVEDRSVGGDHADHVFVHHSVGQQRAAFLAPGADAPVALAATAALEYPAGAAHLRVPAHLDLLQQAVNNGPSGLSHAAPYRTSKAKLGKTVLSIYRKLGG